MNLFVVGAMKAGTTTFVDTLVGHSSICISPIKEPHYFVDSLPSNLYSPSRFFNVQHYLDKEFPAPLHIANIREQKDYDRIFEPCVASAYKLDASTAYMHAPESSKAIHDYNPEAKCILLLRDPIKRAYSHYTMDVGLGRQAKSFEEAIASEIKMYASKTLPWNSYLGMSFYSKSIGRYIKQFGKEQVMVLHFEELVKNRIDSLQQVSTFLDIDEFQITTTAHKNKSRTVRFRGLMNALTRMGVKDLFSRIFGHNFKQKVFKMISKTKSRELPLSEASREELNRIFDKES